MTNSIMIDLQSVSKKFGSVEAVKNLSLQIPKGELFCFLGPNGAGKTTTIKMMTGLLRPNSGKVLIKGFDVLQDSMSARRIMGYIPDFPYLYERLTALEYFRFVGELYGIPKAVVDAEMQESFVLFGLSDYAHTLIKDLSHGFRQRVVYASAFLHKPEALFVDEPFIGLDPYTIRLIKDLLHAKAKAGMTIFLTTHILALIEDLADRIGIILDGNLRAVGTLQELRGQSALLDGHLEDVFFRLTK